MVSGESRTRNELRLNKLRPNKDRADDWFINGVMNKWKMLCSHQVSASTMNTFIGNIIGDRVF